MSLHSGPQERCSARVCQDVRGLNEQLTSNSGVLEDLLQILNKMFHSMCFSLRTLAQGFVQLKFAQEDRHLARGVPGSQRRAVVVRTLRDLKTVPTGFASYVEKIRAVKINNGGWTTWRSRHQPFESQLLLLDKTLHCLLIADSRVSANFAKTHSACRRYKSLAWLSVSWERDMCFK